MSSEKEIVFTSVLLIKTFFESAFSNNKIMRNDERYIKDSYVMLLIDLDM